LYVIHDVMNFNEYVNNIDIRVDNVRPDENWSQLKLILFSWVELSRALWTLWKLNSTQLKMFRTGNKMLSYRRETTLQGTLVLAESGRLELGDNILLIL